MHSNSIALEAEAMTAKNPFRRGAIGIVHKLWRDILHYRAQRALATQLHSLDDRTLADIGLDRGQINSVVFCRNRP